MHTCRSTRVLQVPGTCTCSSDHTVHFSSFWEDSVGFGLHRDSNHRSPTIKTYPSANDFTNPLPWNERLQLRNVRLLLTCYVFEVLGTFPGPSRCLDSKHTWLTITKCSQCRFQGRACDNVVSNQECVWRTMPSL